MGVNVHRKTKTADSFVGSVMCLFSCVSLMTHSPASSALKEHCFFSVQAFNTSRSHLLKWYSSLLLFLNAQMCGSPFHTSCHRPTILCTVISSFLLVFSFPCVLSVPSISSSCHLSHHCAVHVSFQHSLMHCHVPINALCVSVWSICVSSCVTACRKLG